MKIEYKSNNKAIYRRVDDGKWRWYQLARTPEMASARAATLNKSVQIARKSQGKTNATK